MDGKYIQMIRNYRKNGNGFNTHKWCGNVIRMANNIEQVFWCSIAILESWFYVNIIISLRFTIQIWNRFIRSGHLLPALSSTCIMWTCLGLYFYYAKANFHHTPLLSWVERTVRFYRHSFHTETRPPHGFEICNYNLALVTSLSDWV